ncbi:MAG: CoA transferase [Deltaproteobacteria bacterium]|nr:CoA transferase [Deltaproteobacteria bacterium]
MPAALSHLRICDFTGQLAGAGATKWLAAFGAEVIRIEDPVTMGLWDILRPMPPFVDERRGPDFGGGFNNHNVEKLGITLNLRTEKAREILAEIVKRSDVVSENFAKGVLARWGFGYERLKQLKPDIIYVSNCGFGHVGPYSDWKTWGPIVQAISGLTHLSGLPGREPAGWGYSYMDHTGGMYMALAILLALVHRQRTGEGQWVDMSCTDAGLSLTGTAVLDWTVNGRPSRREGWPDANRSAHAPWAPHGIYPAAGEDEWIAIACRSDAEWRALAAKLGIADARFATAPARLAAQDALDAAVGAATRAHAKFALARELQALGIAAAAVAKPEERIDHDANTAAWGLWPTSTHAKMGRVRVDGLPVHLSKTDWKIEHGAPCLGEHTELVLNRVLGMSADDVAKLRAEGVV